MSSKDRLWSYMLVMASGDQGFVFIKPGGLLDAGLYTSLARATKDLATLVKEGWLKPCRSFYKGQELEGYFITEPVASKATLVPEFGADAPDDCDPDGDREPPRHQCGRARWLMELRTGWLVSIGAVSGRRATA
jgi:hypothetical protein